MSASEKTAAGSMISLLHFLPQDILVEILSKLPAKSLVRFRCVSKFFYALVADHAFGVMHRSLSLKLPSREGILISISARHSPSPAYYTINLSDENPRRPGMLQANRLAYLDTEPLLIGCLGSSSDGLICLSRPIGDVVVFNVSTGQRISLPRIQFHCPYPHSTCALLGFDSQSKRYKVLMSARIIDQGSRSNYIEYKHWVLTVGVDKSWREINFTYSHPFSPSDLYPCPSYCNSVYIDGIIYFYNWRIKDYHIIASFEFRSESCSLIPFPVEGSSSSSQYHYCDHIFGCFTLLQVDGGRLAIVLLHKRGSLCYMDVSTWEKSKECWEKITMPIPLEESRTINQSLVVHYTTNHFGEIVLLCKNSERFSILVCNLKSTVWRQFDIGKSTVWRQFDIGGVEEFPFLYCTDVRMYRTRDNVFSLE
ncbi:putative F-box protein At5g62660 [Ipomoea triloba]|uniref:putative F-box protein At5g62660 n=1 Tax=Ipomoea triloba TaxID=35885 RepID=UPI00125DCE0A|nr:putative F-box protein At5g62660 [Ipomoea triloba]